MCKVEVIEMLLRLAGILEEGQEVYVSYRIGQPPKHILQEHLKEKYPDWSYEVIEQLNGRTIKRITP